MGYIDDYFSSRQEYLESSFHNQSEYKFVLSDSAATEKLSVPPAGWNELGLTFRRDKTYHGILRSGSVALRFSRKNGAGWDFILNNYLVYGIEAEVYIKIFAKNGQTDDYDLFYDGVLDFTPSNFTISRDFLEISIIDGSKQHKFKTRDEIESNLYNEISLDDITITPFVSAPTDVTCKPINITRKYNDSGITLRDTVYLFGSDTYFSELMPLYTEGATISTNEIGDSIDISTRLSTQTTQNNTPSTPPIPPSLTPTDHADKVVYTNTTGDTATVTVTLAGTYTLDLNGNASTFDTNMDFKVVQKNSVDTVLETDTIANYNATGLDIYSDSGSMSHTKEYTVLADGYLEIYGDVTVYNRSFEVVFDVSFTITNLNISELTAGEEETTAKCFKLHDAMSRSIQLNTSETDTSKLLYAPILGDANSEFSFYTSTGEWSDLVFTNGRAIRKYPNTAIPYSFKELFQSVDAVTPIGLHYDRVNERFNIGDRKDYYDDTYFMFDLGEVKNLEIESNNEAYFSKIKTGYKNKVSNEKLNGANEVNLPSEHTVSLPVKNTKDLQSPVDAASTMIEQARRNQYNRYGTTDTRWDENKFIIHVDSANETVQGATNVTGFDGVDELYNLRITPRENLLRHIPSISPQLWKSTQKIKFSQSQKDVDISYTNQQGTTVNEQDDIVEGEFLESAYYQPELHICESPISAANLAIMNANPHGYVTYSFNGVNYEAFINELETLIYNKTAKFTLLPKSGLTGSLLLTESGDILTTENDLGFTID